MPPVPAAALVRGALVRTTAAHRPAPSLLTYPGLTSRPFWDVSAFPAVRAIVDSVDVVRAEYARAASALASDYIVADGEHKLHAGSWSWRSFVTKGRVQPHLAALCPETARLLLQPDLMADGVPFAYAFFSTLAGGASIAPHHGPSNLRLRVHVPLVVPSSDPDVCGLSVAGEARPWTEPLVFDDAFEHATWNRSASERVVLLFDVWHPDLSVAERGAVVRMFNDARAAGWLK